MKTALLVVVVASLATCLPAFVIAQQSDRTVPKDLLTQAVCEYGFSLGLPPGKNQPAEFTRLPEPILSWTNPLRNTPDGSVFLWTYRGRPQVIACIYTYGEANIDHEFQSLSNDVIVAERNKKLVWNPQTPGVEFKILPEASVPAASAAKRLTQMRTIAREFGASVDVVTNRHELRLLPQPLYRYPQQSSQVLDGAIFAFVQATDPEILLLLEAQQTDDTMRWYYALARMSDRMLEVFHGGKLVWTVKEWHWQERNMRHPYIKFTETIKP